MSYTITDIWLLPLDHHGFLILKSESLRSGKNQSKLGNLPDTRLELRVQNLPLKITPFECKKIRKIYDIFITFADFLRGEANPGPDCKKGSRPTDQINKRSYCPRNNDLKRSLERNPLAYFLCPAVHNSDSCETQTPDYFLNGHCLLSYGIEQRHLEPAMNNRQRDTGKTTTGTKIQDPDTCGNLKHKERRQGVNNMALPDILFILSRDEVDPLVPGEKQIDIFGQPVAAQIIQVDAVVPAKNLDRRGKKSHFRYCFTWNINASMRPSELRYLPVSLR